MDTDLEVIKSFSDLINLGCFICFQAPSQISAGTIGAKQYHPYIGLLLDWYRMIHFRKAYIRVANVRFISKITRLFYGIKLQGRKITFGEDIHLFPRDYFCPASQDGHWITSKNTYAIHLGTGMW